MPLFRAVRARPLLVAFLAAAMAVLALGALSSPALAQATEPAPPAEPAPSEPTPAGAAASVEPVRAPAGESVLLDRVAVRFTAPETGGIAKPQFIFERELAFEARLEALTDGRPRAPGPADGF